MVDPHGAKALSPAADHLSRRILSRDDAAGEVRVEYVAKAEFANRHGTVAGGFIAAMLDSATSLAALSRIDDDETVVSTRLDVTFRRPVAVGRVEAIAHVIDCDGRDIQTSASLLDSAGEVLASAKATLRRVLR